MKTAIVCDWLTTYGGAEHVIRALRDLWPDATLFTSVTAPQAAAKMGGNIHTSSLQPLYGILRRHQPLLPFMPRAMEDLDLRGYDLIISSSHAVGKGIIPPSRAVHVCYCHTPVRYAWEMEDAYLDDFGLRGVLRTRAKAELRDIRRWDLTTALRTDAFIANSRETQERIQRIYGRESTVIPPPVSDRFLAHPLPSGSKSSYLAIGRLVPYKRFDLLIELANSLKLPLSIGGVGQDAKRLKAMAGPTVTFLDFVKDEDLPRLYANAKALLFPQHEDAGIVPLEAQACGTPVVAYGKGGVLDSVEENVTGIFAQEQTVESFRKTLDVFSAHKWNADAIRTHAKQFSQTQFMEKMMTTVKEALRTFGAHARAS